MAEDVIDNAKDIAKDLNELGYSDLAQEITDSIKFSSTGTELFMKLRWNLDNILKEQKKIDRNIRNKIKNLINDINNKLI